MRTTSLVSVAVLLACVAAAEAGVASINSVKMVNREFNDYPDSTLVAVNNYPSLVSWDEKNFGEGGFANRHTAYFSQDGGATKFAFGYTDGFDTSTVLSLTSVNINGREAGYHADLFGFGFFGILPNGHVAAFGSILPFWDPGAVFTPGVNTTVKLRMVYTPGAGNGTADNGGVPSTMTYSYDFGSGPVSSGPLAFGGIEGGVPAPFPWYIGFGTQNVGSNDTETSALFSETTITPVAPVPAPGVAGLAGLAGLVGLRRRR